MKKLISFVLVLDFVLLGIFGWNLSQKDTSIKQVLSAQVKHSHWLVLHRKSNLEYLYFGIPGDLKQSNMIKKFQVKTGIPGQRPTPLPKLLGRKYWLIIAKTETPDSLETAPYFLSLDVPISEKEPYGPTPYLECDGQCDWVLPGAFGLHGVAGDESKLSAEDPGSSGCIRHQDADITFLYKLLDPKAEEIRYYIEES